MDGGWNWKCYHAHLNGKNNNKNLYLVFMSLAGKLKVIHDLKVKKHAYLLGTFLTFCVKNGKLSEALHS